MATQDEMLRAIHKADPKTLSQRYSPAQLQAAFNKLKSSTAPAATPQQVAAPAPVAPAPAAPAPQAAPAMPTGQPATPGLPANAEQGQNQLSQVGAGIAQGQLQSGAFSQPFQFEANDAARQRIEDAAYARLTRRVGDKETVDNEMLKQNLADRGIPYSNDPNSRYQQEFKDLNDRYDTIRENAAQDAVNMGGQEMQRNYDISSGAYNTGLAGLSSLSQLGLQGTLGFEGNKLQAQATQAAIDKANADRAAQLEIAARENATRRAIARMQTRRTGGGGVDTSNYGFGTTDPGGGASGL